MALEQFKKIQNIYFRTALAFYYVHHVDGVKTPLVFPYQTDQSSFCPPVYPGNGIGVVCLGKMRTSTSNQVRHEQMILLILYVKHSSVHYLEKS